MTLGLCCSDKICKYEDVDSENSEGKGQVDSERRDRSLNRRFG